MAKFPSVHYHAPARRGCHVPMCTRRVVRPAYTPTWCDSVKCAVHTGATTTHLFFRAIEGFGQLSRGVGVLRDRCALKSPCRHINHLVPAKRTLDFTRQALFSRWPFHCAPNPELAMSSTAPAVHFTSAGEGDAMETPRRNHSNVLVAQSWQKWMGNKECSEDIIQQISARNLIPVVEPGPGRAAARLRSGQADRNHSGPRHTPAFVHRTPDQRIISDKVLCF